MKNIIFLFLFLATVTGLNAQDYLISLAGTGSSTTVDSIVVSNLTQGTSCFVPGGDQLQLLGSLTGIEPLAGKEVNALTIYPNPSSAAVSLSFYSSADALAGIELFDPLGKNVASKHVYLETGRHSFSLSGLNHGIYTLTITSEACHYSGKIISRSSANNNLQIIYQGLINKITPVSKARKSGSVIRMQYTNGDLLKFKAFSETYSTVFMDIPATSKTITFAFASCTDYDNNHYSIVQIGNQTWMSENLKSKNYSDGTPVSYYIYDNDPANYLIYGSLYSWSNAMKGASSSNSNPSNVQGVCPDGWHLPSKSEWEQLSAFLGGLTTAGGKLKERGNDHWVLPNTGATDESGFCALPAGMHDFTGIFQWYGDHSAFSSSTADLGSWEVTSVMLINTNPTLTVGTFHPYDAVSVRCVKN